MKQYKKTLSGSIVAFVVGTSCCWLTSLAIWLGGVAFIGTVVSFIEGARVILIVLGVILLILTLYLYSKKNKNSSGKKVNSRR